VEIEEYMFYLDSGFGLWLTVVDVYQSIWDFFFFVDDISKMLNRKLHALTTIPHGWCFRPA
jgi:hypothetical protein